ncbi:MAG: hypothetical protein KC613_27420, partial [Myxococcales bacterium]|nr:hypothetical protein [Myxococcales bacterium]
MRRALPLLNPLAPLALLVALAWPGPAAAFVYLEHGYFTDRACHAALDRLAALPALGHDVDLTARFLALALICPARPLDTPYCRDGQKQATALMHVLGEPPDEAGESPITAGDLSALGDHISRFGPVRRLPRADRDGLLARMAEWLFLDDDGVGGVVGDVAEEQCLRADTVPWPVVEQDIAAALVAGAVPPQDEALRRPLAREDAPQGPVDPDGLFSFLNPHYLDMVERNASHFAPAAHGHWGGFHAAANAVVERGCDDALALDDDDLDELADEAEKSSGGGCRVVADRLVERLDTWRHAAPERWVAPVRLSLRALTRGQAPVLRQALAGAFFGAALEAAGQHYLQDQFSGGHIRVDRGTLDLQESRYEHNTDGEHGVLAWLVTGAGGRAFVAYGDGRLLGPRAVQGPHACDADAAPAVVTDCLVRHQRGLVILASTASFVDWALGNPTQTAPAARCDDRPG